MKQLYFFAAILVLNMATITHAQDKAAENALIAMGSYVASDDIARSEAFYRILFDQNPIIRLEDFVAFDVADGWFAIVSRTKYAPESQPGRGAVPYIQSGNLETIRQRAVRADKGVAPTIIVEPNISVLKIIDPDGQLIEFFTLTGD